MKVGLFCQNFERKASAFSFGANIFSNHDPVITGGRHRTPQNQFG
jgi:hypothetical protein